MLPAPFSIDEELFLLKSQSARRGTAADPSGMLLDHLRPVFNTHFVFQCVPRLAREFCTIDSESRLAFGMSHSVEDSRWRRLGCLSQDPFSEDSCLENAKSPLQFGGSTESGV